MHFGKIEKYRNYGITFAASVISNDSEFENVLSEFIIIEEDDNDEEEENERIERRIWKSECVTKTKEKRVRQNEYQQREHEQREHDRGQCY